MIKITKGGKNPSGLFTYYTEKDLLLQEKIDIDYADSFQAYTNRSCSTPHTTLTPSLCHTHIVYSMSKHPCCSSVILVFALTQIISNEFHVELFTHNVNLKTRQFHCILYNSILIKQSSKCMKKPEHLKEYTMYKRDQKLF